MQVEIHYSQVELDKAIEAHIRRKLVLALSRIEIDISAISINLSEVVGAKGSSGKHCLLTISMDDLADIVVEDMQVDLYCVIDRVIQKASHVMTRRFLPK